jgi:hypothetical protein
MAHLLVLQGLDLPHSFLPSWNSAISVSDHLLQLPVERMAVHLGEVGSGYTLVVLEGSLVPGFRGSMLSGLVLIALEVF